MESCSRFGRSRLRDHPAARRPDPAAGPAGARSYTAYFFATMRVRPLLGELRVAGDVPAPRHHPDRAAGGADPGPAGPDRRTARRDRVYAGWVRPQPRIVGPSRLTRDRARTRQGTGAATCGGPGAIWSPSPEAGTSATVSPCRGGGGAVDHTAASIAAMGAAMRVGTLGSGSSCSRTSAGTSCLASAWCWRARRRMLSVSRWVPYSSRLLSSVFLINLNIRRKTCPGNRQNSLSSAPPFLRPLDLRRGQQRLRRQEFEVETQAGRVEGAEPRRRLPPVGALERPARRLDADRGDRLRREGERLARTIASSVRRVVCPESRSSVDVGGEAGGAHAEPGEPGGGRDPALPARP